MRQQTTFAQTELHVMMCLLLQQECLTDSEHHVQVTRKIAEVIKIALSCNEILKDIDLIEKQWNVNPLQKRLLKSNQKS